MSPQSSVHHRAVNMPSLGCGESRVVTSWREGKRLHSLWVCLPLGREGCSQELARNKRVTRFAGALAQGLKGIASRYWTVIDGHETPLFKTSDFSGYTDLTQKLLLSIYGHANFPPCSASPLPRARNLKQLIFIAHVTSRLEGCTVGRISMFQAPPSE